MRRLITLSCLASLFVLGTAHAAGTPKADAPPPPALGTAVDDGATSEPEIQIYKKGDSTIEEHRINGRLYLVKVTPAVGAPYYLYDDDGSGQMRRLDNPGDRLIIPRWVLFRF